MSVRLVGALAAAVMSVSGAARGAEWLGNPVFSQAPIGYSWTGFYVGAKGGSGFGGQFEGALTGAAGADKIELQSPSGFVAGGQAGYNYQHGAGAGAVFGLEADLSHAAIRSGVAVTGGGASAELWTEATWLATVRARLGYASHRMLMYATGGAAWTSIELGGSLVGGGVTAKGTEDHIHLGWTVGTGVEVAIHGNWSLQAEYLYAWFGKEEYLSAPLTLAAGAPAGLDVSLQTHLLRLGLNHRF